MTYFVLAEQRKRSAETNDPLFRVYEFDTAQAALNYIQPLIFHRKFRIIRGVECTVDAVISLNEPELQS